MAVYKFRTMDALYGAIRRIGGTLFGDFRCKLTAPEFISAFIQPEHVAPLRQVQDMVGLVGNHAFYSKFMTSDDVEAKLTVLFARNEPPIILPNYVSDGVTKSAPEDVVLKMRAFVDERVRLGRLFGDAIDSVRYLNDHCGNANAMSVMFPVLPALMKYADPDGQNDSSFAKRASKLASAKSFGTLPKLPQAVKQRILEASNAVQTSLMLDQTNGPDEKHARGTAFINVERLTDNAHDFIYEALGQKQPASFV